MAIGRRSRRPAPTSDGACSPAEAILAARPAARHPALAAIALAAIAIAGCGGGGGDDREQRASGPGAGGERDDSRSRPSDPRTSSDARGGRNGEQGAVESTLRPARCPAGAGNCRSASGRILYVEEVDPDGDGDAHFVLVSTDSVTAPGISVIDVGVELRPEPLPEVGDRISAAGPVYVGSYGQRQIEADELNVAG